jgi:hypothetical protein
MANEGAIEYERVFKDKKAKGSKLFDLEQKNISYKQNRNGTKDFFYKSLNKVN